ncbi:MAG TPA: carboxypeptidase regulatory-like domain-containing protein [Gemmatimonadales bacterium]
MAIRPSVVLSLYLLTVLAASAAAQTTTGSVRGYVTDDAGAPVAGAEITTRNLATGVQRTTTSQSNGFYALPGLAPAEYEVSVRAIGVTPTTRRLQVLVGQTLTLDFRLARSAVTLAEVAVVAEGAIETRTSEVAVNVSSHQIERLPTASRNFLDLAALAPGLTVTEDRVNALGVRTFSAGGQGANAINIFIDGTSLKNDLTGGGVAGQDASRGNPFPRSAIQEYRVISQNFKAEYQKASSAIITATTKSGGNVWSGNALFGYQGKGLVALDTFQVRDKRIADSIARVSGDPSTFKEPDYARYLTSLSIGGPIKRERLFFFGSYEGNYQDRANRVNFTPPTGFAALDTVGLTQYNGDFTSPFRETMLFGKLTYVVSERSSAELSFSTRQETDVRDFGNVNCPGFMCAHQVAVNFRQDVSVAQLRHSHVSGAWLNEAKVDYSRFRRNPRPNDPGVPQRVFQYNNTDNVIGSNLSTQDFIQERVGFRDDLTYSGFQAGGDHVLKLGVSVDFVTYDVFKGNDETPRFLYRADVSGRPYNFRNPYELRYGTGNPSLRKNNAQIGAYVQDDWSPTPRLTINLGIRWDFESKMMNYDYQTPQMVIDTLTRYNSSLPTPLDLSRYISTGSNRKPFYGAFQPRLGFSYALDEDNATTIFGGFGIYYDRTLFDVAIDETLKLTRPTYTIRFAHPDSTPQPGEVAWNNSYLTADKATLDALVGTFGRPEAWLIDRNVKLPQSRQWNLGVRRVVGDFLVSATYAAVRGVDQLTLNWANVGLNPNGSCCTSFDLAPHGFSNFIYSSNDAKTWYDALQIQLDRPYRRSGSQGISWGGGVAVTFANRSLQGVDGLGDLFAFPNTANIPKHPSNDEQTRVVANWIIEVPYAEGVQFSGLITLGSGNRKDVGCPARFCGPGYHRGAFTPPDRHGFIIPGAFAYRRVDLRLRKDFPNIAGTTLGVTADLFNAFNYQNLGDYDTDGNPATNANWGKARRVESDPRRLQIGVEYNF